MQNSYINALKYAKVLNHIWSILGLLLLFGFVAGPLLFVIFNLSRIIAVLMVFGMIYILFYIIKRHNNRISKTNNMSNKIEVNVNEFEIEFIPKGGAVYYFKGTYTFENSKNIGLGNDELLITQVYECRFDDGACVLTDYMRKLKQKKLYPEMEVWINPLDYAQYYIDSDRYMMKLAQYL